MKKTIQKIGYSVLFSETGRWIGLYDNINPQSNWIAEKGEHGFCVPFIHGTQQSEDDLPCPFVYNEPYMESFSPSKAAHVQVTLDEEIIHIHFHTIPDCGPRMGLQMDWNLLDLPTDGTWRNQCMPKVIYVDENYQYAYFVFATADHRYMILTVSSPLSAWRIKYSYAGHRMTGFQLLTQADDVITDGRGALPVVDALEIQIQFADSLDACFKKISHTLGIAMAIPRVSGGIIGAEIPWDIIGKSAVCEIQEPDRVKRHFQNSASEDKLVLEKTGIYQLIAISPNGRKHISRILCHDNWETQFDRVNQFYRRHFQDETGAFYRVVSTDTLMPDKETFEGCSFGNPHLHHSCRTGEFGGFAAWAMIKNQLVFGEKTDLQKSVEQYLLNWALNRGHEDTPYYGTVYKKPNSFLGRDYGPYHLYEEVNYLQHEIFLLEEMADYYRLNPDASILSDAIALAEHIIAEHMESDGTIINQNTPNEPGTDYSTVHITVCGFLRWANILRDIRPEQALKLLQAAEKVADHVCKRALDFPTEGESCTEDGSMGCSVATLVYAYLQFAPKPEYLTVAREILNAHHVLELNGTDCRMKNSTIRFWETQYETRAWGPSINAGHAWTIWTAEAKAALAMVDGDIQLLQESYEGFLTNICKVDKGGGMFCCYTPDMIPGTPHGYFRNPEGDKHDDLRPTSTHLGMAYPPKSYATSGNYYLIKAAEIWNHVSGLNLESDISINGRYENNVFYSAAPQFDCLFLHSVSPKQITVKCVAGKKMKLYVNSKELKITHADILDRDENSCTVLCTENEIIVHIL